MEHVKDSFRNNKWLYRFQPKSEEWPGSFNILEHIELMKNKKFFRQLLEKGDQKKFPKFYIYLNMSKALIASTWAILEEFWKMQKDLLQKQEKFSLLNYLFLYYHLQWCPGASVKSCTIENRKWLGGKQFIRKYKRLWVRHVLLRRFKQWHH